MDFSVIGLVVNTAIGAIVGGMIGGAVAGARAYARGESWAIILQEMEDGAFIGAKWGAAIGAASYLGVWALSKAFFASVGNIVTADILAKTFVGFHASAVGFALSINDYQEAVQRGDEVEQRLALMGLVISGTGMAASRYGVYTTNAPRVSVIGPVAANPSYVDLAKSINGNYFQLPAEDWNAMTPAQRIFANKVFLDEAIGRGDTFRISTNSVNPFSDTAEEIKYILGQSSKFGQTSTGYTRSADGMYLNPPNGK